MIFGAFILVAVLAIISVEAFRVQQGWTRKTLLHSDLQSQPVEKKLNPRDEVSVQNILSDGYFTIGLFIQRRRILKTDNYNRMGFKEEKQEVQAMMLEEFASPLVKELRENNGKLQRGDVTILLAEHYGFCWGVERSVSI
jgi:hypothetical protein